MSEKLLSKLQKMYDSIDKEYKHKTRPMEQNPTPKRMREYYSRVRDGERLHTTMVIIKNMMKLATEQPDHILLPKWQKLSKKQIIDMTARRSDGNGGLTNEFYDTREDCLILQSLWNRECNSEHDERVALDKLLNEVRFSKIPGYFPTPSNVVDRMLERIPSFFWDHGLSVLEPSAGTGSIIEKLRQYENVKIDAVEVNYKLYTILKHRFGNKENVTLHNDDFLQWQLEKQYDLVIMNPPFENGLDVEHVTKAISHLKDDGFLISVMSPAFTFRTNKKYQEFNELLNSMDLYDYVKLDAGSFAESGTNVSTVILYVSK